MCFFSIKHYTSYILVYTIYLIHLVYLSVYIISRTPPCRCLVHLGVHFISYTSMYTLSCISQCTRFLPYTLVYILCSYTSVYTFYLVHLSKRTRNCHILLYFVHFGVYFSIPYIKV